MAREHQQHGHSPERETPPPARVERREKSQKREQAREEEEAVHPAVDPVEEQCPGAGREQRRDDAGGRVGKAAAEQRDQRNARHREDERDDRSAVSPPPRCTIAQAKVKWSGAPPRSNDHGVQHVAERAAADEEREGLVLVRRPGVEEPAEHAGERTGHNRGSGPEGVVACTRVRARASGEL